MKQQYVTCNLCGRDNWKVRFAATLNGAAPQVEAFRCTSAGYGHHPQIVECKHCGYVYANPRWDGEALLTAYTAVEDEIYVQERTGRELTFQKHLQALQKITGPAAGRTLLDVGAYIGVFVEVAQRAGWHAVGVEPSDWAVAEARRLGLPVIAGTMDSPELNGRAFDVLTMWDVIEHVNDPAGELHKAYHLLKPGGILAVHTMDIDSFTARLLGERWPWLMEMHIHYFSKATLRRMVEMCGFRILWVGAQGRYLRLGYLASRLEGFSKRLGRTSAGVVSRMHLSEFAVPVNFGDLITLYACRE